MSLAFKKWIESKKRDRYKLYEIVEMSGLPWSTFRLYQHGKFMTRKTARKVHEATGITMEDLGFIDVSKVGW